MWGPVSHFAYTVSPRQLNQLSKLWVSEPPKGSRIPVKYFPQVPASFARGFRSDEICKKRIILSYESRRAISLGAYIILENFEII